MIRIRKEPNRYWLKEDKLKLINEVLDDKSSQEIVKNNYISVGLLRNWIIKYNKYGIESLDNKMKLGDLLFKCYGYHRKNAIIRREMSLVASVNLVHKAYNVKRAMSIIETPIDDSIIESNKWLVKSFNQENYIETIIYDHNYLRSSYVSNKCFLLSTFYWQV